MSKRSLLIVGLLAVLWAAAAPAGEIRIHYWPCSFVPQAVTTIPVIMDVGYWIQIENQDAFIKLQQTAINTYEGCTNLRVRCNARLAMGCSIEPTGAVPGTYSSWISDSAGVDPPGGTVKVCAKLKNPDLSGQPGGSVNVKVASVTITVVPRSL